MKRVLIGARNFGHGGGVVGVVRVLLPHLCRVEARHFQLGRPPGATVAGAWSVCRDNQRLHRLKGRWDLLHLNSSLRPRALSRDGILMANWGHRPAVVTFHGWSEALWRTLHDTPLARRWFVSTFGGRTVIALADRFRQGLIALGLAPEDVLVIGPAYDGTPFGTGIAPAASRVVYLGRLEPEKGVFDLLEGFRAVADRAELVLVGSGSAAPAIRQWVSARGLGEVIRLTGRLEGRDKARMLESATVFALPSASEGLPVAMLEAMAAGLPVVVTDVGGISEVVEPGRNGWLLDDPGQVGEALVDALDHPALCREMGARNRSRVAGYEAEVIAARTETAYLRALGVRG